MKPTQHRYLVPLYAVMLSASPAMAAKQASAPSEAAEARSAHRAPAPAARAAAPASPRELSRYAAREAKNPDAKRFAGGHEVVYISASAVAVVLAIVLLIVLL